MYGHLQAPVSIIALSRNKKNQLNRNLASENLTCKILLQGKAKGEKKKSYKIIFQNLNTLCIYKMKCKLIDK